jgi:hypothetical protein
MVDSQPGEVAAFDPEITLSGISVGTRDKFMFNENQLVLAKIQKPNPTTAAAVNRSTSNSLTTYDSYKNLEGEFTYIDGSFQALNTTGVPVLPVHRLEVGFDQQVITDTIKFWSTTFVDTTLIQVQYSFDNVTWFAAGSVTWVQFFDDTIELFPGDSPPTGAYRYTGTIDAGNVTARYWRISSDIQLAVTNYSAGTATVASTDGFPASTSSGSVLILTSGGSVKGTGEYTGKTSTTFTGWTGTEPAAGDLIINLDSPFGSGTTEIEILEVTGPILQHWNSDGSQAVTNAIEGSNYYDITYDKSEDVYYAIRFEETLSGSSTVDPDDDFDDTSFGSGFDTSKWVESTLNSYFIHNTSSGTLDMKSSGGKGQLTSNYGIDGSTKANVELVAAIELNDTAFFGLEFKDYSNGNQYSVSALKGPYIPASDTSGKFVAAAAVYSDTVLGAAELQDFRINPNTFTFDIVGGLATYSMLYDAGSDIYTVTASGEAKANLTPGVPYSIPGAEFTIANLSTPADGQGFTVNVYCAETSIAGTSVSGINLELERIGTNGYVRYEDTDVPGFNTLVTANIPSNRLSIQLMGDPVSQAVDVGVDNFTVTSGTVFFDSPVFSLVTINKDGNLEQVSGVSDADGYAIKVFDVIQQPQDTFNDYLYPKVGIATNGALHGSGGEVYIKINDTMYKYLKSALPLAEDDGSSASVTTTGEIPTDTIANFSYSGYTQGALSYIEYISDLSGVFVKSISTTNMLATSKKALLDVSTINHAFAWNVSDQSTLYFVDGTEDLKLYDLNETKAGFVNVTSDKQVLAAGTAETATITAQVLNVYGEPKSAKTMTFSVSAGDGAVSPATGCSDGSGNDTTTYTVGSAVGTATITVTVSDITCVP